MSHDNAPGGHVDEQRHHGDEGLGWWLARVPGVVVANLRDHVSEWSDRYVDQQAALYER
ncbi:hypothetical protein [Halobacterium salinarum]|uniref:hypothetical protein n=1 Tax=Halobacterium salinarum TaxID=2242 RepID=UPI001F469D7A|nr:hypothetical protein [Halobacterium salinarum]MCF2164338.1 hypothetical protein [Halobacterium salinarum]MCF2167125.1 hypothetical protein [Halobacterium salinarum]